MTREREAVRRPMTDVLVMCLRVQGRVPQGAGLDGWACLIFGMGA